MNLQLEKIAKDVSALAKGQEKCIGFIPHTIYAPAFAEARLLVDYEGGECAGFLLRGRIRHELKIFQTFIPEELRLRARARRMVEQIIAVALEHDAERVSLHCATDLAANEFWQACGFSIRAMRPAKSEWARPAYKWVMELPTGEALEKMVSERMSDPKVKAVCQAFGVERLVADRLTRKFRRKFFGRGPQR